MIEVDKVYLGLCASSREAVQRFATRPARWVQWMEEVLGPFLVNLDEQLEAPSAHLLSRPHAFRSVPSLLHPGWLPDRQLFRAVVICYDKRERIYRGAIDVASIRIWLRGPRT